MYESINLISCSSILAAGLCLLTSMFVIKRQRSEKIQETLRIQAIQLKIEAVLLDDSHDTSMEAFSTTLKTARLTTELQLPRLQSLAKIEKHPPEKYKILSKLASQGMGAEEIASILEISRIEAGQLLSLCNMAKCGQ
jgi:hypothetical protein